ncbi:MAG: archaeal proteasome endopeptidase complex subunit beta [Candidatus Bathyarchaeia archaeon]|jgi:proteasome beta subunit
MSEPFMPGATTIGVVCKDGVVLASERRVSYGYFIQSKSGKKIFRVSDTIGAACAGLVGDMQVLTKEVAAQLSVYAFERDRAASVRSAAKVMANLLFERRMFPYLAQTIVGGIDDEGPSLFVLDPLGSVIDDKFASVGSGSEIAIGVLEAEFKEGLSVEQGKELVKKAAKAALARDIGSGNGLDFMTITKSGIKEEGESLS